jgi:hypothetical protein
MATDTLLVPGVFSVECQSDLFCFAVNRLLLLSPFYHKLVAHQPDFLLTYNQLVDFVLALSGLIGYN